jgi:hypothetical protein
MKEPVQSDALARQRLSELREALMKLHKALIDSERISYEQTFGSISSPANFLRLLTDDPWFAWLRPLSRFIANIDEALDSKEEPVTNTLAEQFAKAAREMLVTDESGQGFGRQYFEALQRDPDVVLAHGQFTKLRKPV